MKKFYLSLILLVLIVPMTLVLTACNTYNECVCQSPGQTNTGLENLPTRAYSIQSELHNNNEIFNAFVMIELDIANRTPITWATRDTELVDTAFAILTNTIIMNVERNDRTVWDQKIEHVNFHSELAGDWYQIPVISIEVREPTLIIDGNSLVINYYYMIIPPAENPHMLRIDNIQNVTRLYGMDGNIQTLVINNVTIQFYYG